MALKSKMKFYNIFSFKSFTMNFTIGFQPSIWIFIVSAGLLWIASNKLSKVVNFIDTTFHLGSSFGGTVILSVVTNLPEIAITVNGALKGDTDLAIGNILGGIVIQSVLLVLFDFASRKEKKPLSSLVSNKASIIQGIFLIIILALVILGKQMKESQILYRSTVPELMIVFSWVVSIILLKKIQKGTTDHDSKPAEKPHKSTYTKTSALLWLTGISLVILIFGVLLEVTSDAIASHFHLNGIIFGATVLALVTSLPEISGGLAFVREKTWQPIISDIFGGNSFLPVLFLVATAISNDALLPRAANTDLYLTVVAIIITAVYITGMILQLPGRKKGLGADSWVVLVLYLVSVVGLFYIS